MNSTAVSKWSGSESWGALSPCCHVQKLRSVWAALGPTWGPSSPGPRITSRVTTRLTGLRMLGCLKALAAAAITVSR